MSRPRIRLGDLSVGHVQGVIGALRQHGVDPAPLLARFALDGGVLDDPGEWLSIPRYMRLGHAAIACCGDPALGLEMGRQLRLAHLGLTGLAVAQAPDLAHACWALTRFEPLHAHNHRGQSSLAAAPNGAWLSFYPIGPYNDYNRFVVDAVLSGWLAQLSEVAAEAIHVDAVQIDYAAPDHQRHAAHFACPVRFAAGVNRLWLSSSTLALRNPRHVPATWRLLLELCEEALARQARGSGLRDRVCRLIAARLGGGEPALEEIAAQLHLPSWTLRRKLAEEGLRFRDLMGDTRRDLALLYIRDTTLSFGEVAYLLGFASAAPFQRAFKRWNGCTPGEYRRRGRAI